MGFNTGDTIIEMVESVDFNNNPLSAATFSQAFFVDGVSVVSPVVNLVLADSLRAIFAASFSANTYGIHQFHLKSNLTNVIYVSDSYNISAISDFDKNIYIGL